MPRLRGRHAAVPCTGPQAARWWRAGAARAGSAAARGGCGIVRDYERLTEHHETIVDKAFTVVSRPSTVERARFLASCWFRHPSSMAWNTCSSGRSSDTPSAR
jgi:hypothetical protein